MSTVLAEGSAFFSVLFSFLKGSTRRRNLRFCSNPLKADFSWKGFASQGKSLILFPFENPAETNAGVSIYV